MLYCAGPAGGFGVLDEDQWVTVLLFSFWAFISAKLPLQAADARTAAGAAAPAILHEENPSESLWLALQEHPSHISSGRGMFLLATDLGCCMV